MCRYIKLCADKIQANGKDVNRRSQRGNVSFSENEHMRLFAGGKRGGVVAVEMYASAKTRTILSASLNSAYVEAVKRVKLVY